MTVRDQATYDSLDNQTLSNLLLNPNQRPDVHRAALSAMSRRKPSERTHLLLDVLQNLVQNPDRYDQHVMLSLIDILATDPDADATEAMLGILPSVLKSARGGGGLTHEFREYFYEALVTRQRIDDIEVWREALPQFSAETLTEILFDPAAKPLESLEPLLLIGRLPKSNRGPALRSIFFRSLFRNPALAFQSLKMMLQASDSPKAKTTKRKR
jgi:hypothetical protein